jgi:hypothetical protein
MPTEFGYFEGEDGGITNFSVSKLGKIISCACGCIYNNTRRNIETTRRR